MASLKEVKSRITSVVSTQQITKAMKMVAAAKLRKSQERIVQMRPFAQKLSGLLKNLSAAGSDGPTWYNTVREEKKVLIVAVSSDRGLCGGFNGSVFKAVIRLIDEKYAAQQRQRNVTILPIGKKALDFFTKRNFPVVNNYALIFSDLSFEKVADAGAYLMEGFRK